jgi:hypothetical protein
MPSKPIEKVAETQQNSHKTKLCQVMPNKQNRVLLTILTIGQPPFPKIRGQEAAPCREGQPPTVILAALKDHSFLLTA